MWPPRDPRRAKARSRIDALLDSRDAGDEADLRLLAERAVAEVFLGECLASDAMRARGAARAARALERFDDEELSPALHGGSIGIAWCLHHALSRGAASDALHAHLHDVLTQVDDAIADALAATADWPDIGILHGLAGVGLYTLERRDPRLVAGVVEALDRVAVADGEGRTFHTPAALTGYPDYFPDGHRNLGLGHGIAGALCFLARAHHRHPSATTHALIDDVVRALLARERPHGHSAFPAILTPDGEALESDAGWAHGDAGVGFAIVAAGIQLERPDWVARGARVAKRSLARPVDTYVQAYSTTITHGSAGLAAIYGRLGHVTGASAYREGARRWLDRLLDAGEDPASGTLVGGALGEALVLMTALHGVEPTWDACLGLTL